MHTADPDDLELQQVLQPQFQTDAEQQQPNANLGQMMQRIVGANPSQVQAKSRHQIPHKRWQPQPSTEPSHDVCRCHPDQIHR